MNNWRKLRNYRKYKKPDGTYTYIIKVDGEAVIVSEDVYSVYAQDARKMEYMESRLKRDRALQDGNGRTVYGSDGLPIMLPEREVSLDKLTDEGWALPPSPSQEDGVLRQLEIKELQRCLEKLDDDELALVRALYYDGLTIREYADLVGMTKSGADRYKAKILSKLKEFLAG